MSKTAARATQYLLDLVVLAVAFVLAFIIRFDGVLPEQMMKRMLFLCPYVAGLQFGLLAFFGAHRFVWRHVALREMGVMARALGCAALVFLIARIVSAQLLDDIVRAQYALVPIGVIIIDFGAALVGIVGLRVMLRLYRQYNGRRLRSAHSQPAVNVLLIGAGDAGAMVAREIAERPDLGIRVVAFVDDDVRKHGRVLCGVPVAGGTAHIGQLCARLDVEQAIITIAQASGKDIRRILGSCERAELSTRIIPGISEILDGRVNMSQVREVSIEDLLGREPVQLDDKLVASFLRNRTVVVTGAGGSIGSELCRQIAHQKPRRLLLIERSEPALFTVSYELRRSFPGMEIEALLCDVCDRERLDWVFSRYRPNVVFHAAAHKHVPMMELNPGEAVKNNVFGSRLVAEAADRHRVDAFVFVSTDKAVNPTSIMGTTKRLAEVFIQALSRRSRTKYMAVRFGNVLGSAGSVIPIFKAQIARGGPVTVTHPEMKRYFMTIPEASQLVLQAGAMGKGGEIFVLDMGSPVAIVDLARDLIRLSGFEPEVDIPIEFTGIRSGEALFEELSFDAEKMDRTGHSKIFCGRFTPQRYELVAQGLRRLRRALENPERDRVRQELKRLVPEMRDRKKVVRRPVELVARARSAGDSVPPPSGRLVQVPA